MGQNGEEVYKEIHDFLLSKTLAKEQKIRIINLLGEIGNLEAATALTTALLDGFDYKFNYAPPPPSLDLELRAAVQNAIREFGIRAVAWGYEDEKYHPENSKPLERLLLAKRGDLELYGPVAMSIATIGTESGVQLLLQELASNQFFGDREKLWRDQLTLYTKAYGERWYNPSPGSSTDINMPELNVPVLETVLRKVRNPQGIQLLIDNLHKGNPKENLTIASGRVLAHLAESSNLESEPIKNIFTGVSQAPAEAAPLAGELFEIMQTNSGSEVIVSRLNGLTFTPDQVRSLVVEKAEQRRKVLQEWESRVVDEAIPQPLPEQMPSTTLAPAQKPLPSGPANTKARVSSILEISLRMHDKNGAHWMHNQLPKEKGLYVTFNGTCVGCTVNSPRKYRYYQSADVNDVGTDKWYLPQEGVFRFDILDTITQPIQITLVDPPGNRVTIETDNGPGTDEAEGKRTLLIPIARDDQQVVSRAINQLEAMFFITDDEFFRQFGHL